jgi:hypothetical protein
MLKTNARSIVRELVSEIIAKLAQSSYQAETMDATKYAADLIKHYGWSLARDMAASEASPHSPTGNRDRFWTDVLAEIDRYNRSGSPSSRH